MAVGAGEQEHIASDITQVRSSTLSCHPIFLVQISFLLLFVADLLLLVVD